MTKKLYKQMWLKFLAKNKNPLRNTIWQFQKSILSNRESEAANSFRLHLDKDDIRSEIIDLSEKLYHNTRIS